MSDGLILILALVAIGAGIYIYRVMYHVKRMMPRAPGLTMQEAWDSWMNNKDKLPEYNRRIVDLVQDKFADSAIENMRKELFDIEEESKKAEDPLIPLRTTIMASVEVCVRSEAILALDEQTKKKVQANLGDQFTDDMLIWGVIGGNFMFGLLRWYSSLKYADAAEDDWFTFYVEHVKTYIKQEVEDLRKQADGKAVAGMSTLFQRLMEQLRKDLLKYPRKTPVPKPEEKPEPPEPPLAAGLTEQQLEQLASLMNDRFVKLCNGELYVVDGIPPPERDKAFELDAGLLLNYIALNLQTPDDCVEYWCRIMEKVLRNYKKDLTMDEVNVALETAKVYREQWTENEDEGPLAAVLALGAACAFKIHPTDEVELIGQVGAKMFDNAGDLMGEVKQIMRGL